MTGILTECTGGLADAFQAAFDGGADRRIMIKFLTASAGQLSDEFALLDDVREA